MAISDRVTEADFAVIHAGVGKLKELITAMNSLQGGGTGR